MTAKDIFSILFYEGLKEALENIPVEETKDVYICKLLIYNYPSYSDKVADVVLKYNTNTALKKQIEEISTNWSKYENQGCGWTIYYMEDAISIATTSEYRQILENIDCGWGRMPIKIDIYAFQCFLDWRNQIDYEDESEKYYEFYAIHFKALMVELCKKLIEEGMVQDKFGKNIPFIVECEEDEEIEIDVAETGILETSKVYF